MSDSDSVCLALYFKSLFRFPSFAVGLVAVSFESPCDHFRAFSRFNGGGGGYAPDDCIFKFFGIS